MKRSIIIGKNRLLLVLIVMFHSVASFALSVGDLRVFTLKNPQGIDSEELCFGWKLSSEERAVVQTAYRIVVAANSDGSVPVWDSGLIESGESSNVLAEGCVLQPSTRYYWSVTVRDNKGNEATSSELAYFDTGLMSSGWSGAKWIKATDAAYGTLEENVKDYVVEVDVEVEHTAAGVCFAKKGDGNYYMWQLNTIDAANPLFRPHVWTNGNPALIGEIPLKGKVDIANGQVHKLRIEITGGGRHAATYIDNVLIDERDGNFVYGDVGIREDYGAYDMQPEKAFFDNFKVSTPDGTVLFAEDFSTTKQFSAGDVVDGRLHVVGSTNGSVYAWQTHENKSVRFTVETDITLVRDNAAVVFAATAPKRYFMWQINTSDSDVPMVRRHIYNNSDAPWHQDVRITAFSKADLIGHERHLKIDVDGNTIRTYIDNTLVDTHEDNSGILTTGDVGLRVDNTSANVKEEAYFDNLVVTEYSAEGKPTVTFSEDFEADQSDYFYNPEIVVVDGNRKCYMRVSGKEYRMMQESSDGAPMFIKDFVTSRKVTSAKLYTSALGVYDVFVNGRRVGHVQPDGSTVYEELKPGWTDYRKRVFYQSHDVTALLVDGRNTIGSVVTSGWWAGAVAKGIYGSPETGFIAKLVITYDDNTVETIVTDETWASSKKGAVRSGDIYDGEVYDARIVTDWTGCDLRTWNAVSENTSFHGLIESQKGPAIRILDNLKMKAKTATVFEGTTSGGSDYGMLNVVSAVDGGAPLKLKKGQAVIFDFGQNFAGWIELAVKGERSTRLHMRFSEMLNDTGEKSRANDGPGGSLYLANLRSAKAQLYYTLSGDAEGETYNPSMTFYGFRYCELTPTADVEILSIMGVPVSSSYEDMGTITTDNEMVNQLFSNIVWGQRSNLISVPTDCPQRDERLGWTADTQVFSNTAMYNSNLSEFYRKWITDVRDGQRDDGAYYDIAPVSWTEFGNGAWADAGVIVPWNVYLMTGNPAIIEDNYDSMEKYMKWLAAQHGDGYLYQGGGVAHGDWLSFAPTDSRYVSVAYYAYDAKLMAKMSRVLSKSENDRYAQAAASYETLFNNIKDEFQKRYFVTETGALKRPTQTACLLALNYGLYKDEAQLDYLKRRLASLITSNGEKLNTGFVGTAIINTTLSDFGLTDKAYNLLLQRACPSWMYSIDQGATTMWERWDSYTKEKGFGDAAMNSFNHYAYGAVGEWMYRNMAGIGADEQKPGFRHIVLKPCPDRREEMPAGQERVTNVSCSYDSGYGKIGAEWTLDADMNLDYSVVVPANTTATLYLPVADADAVVKEGTMPAEQSEGVTFVGYKDGYMVYTLGSGSYHFTTSVSTDVNVVEKAGTLAVYPNPVDDILHISGGEDITRLTLCGMTGNVVMHKDGPRQSLDMSGVQPGVYMLTAWRRSGVSTVKVVKR